MTIQFYAGSGSPYVWRVWLALEHKAIKYEAKLLSFQAGDLTKPEYEAINPRHKVPAIVDDGFSLYESSAIVRYLDEKYPKSGKPLFPKGVKERAVVSRLIAETDAYIVPAVERLVEEILFKPKPEDRDPEAIDEARDALGEEVVWFERAIAGGFLAGSDVSAADFALYPLLALSRRMQTKFVPSLGIDGLIGPNLTEWTKRVEALPYYDKTYPPHWRA